MAVTHWSIQMTLLSSSAKNSQPHSRSFCRGLLKQYNSVVIGLDDDDSTFHQEERFKGPAVTNLLWTPILADYRGQIHWTYSG